MYKYTVKVWESLKHRKNIESLGEIQTNNPLCVGDILLRQDKAIESVRFYRVREVIHWITPWGTHRGYDRDVLRTEVFVTVLRRS